MTMTGKISKIRHPQREIEERLGLKAQNTA